MKLPGDGTWFGLALVFSVGLHVASPLLGKERARQTEPEFALEERVLRAPMTMRVLRDPQAEASAAQTKRSPEAVVASKSAAPRRVLAVEPDSTRIERDQPHFEPLPAAYTLPPPVVEPDAATPPMEAPPPVIPDAPEPEDTEPLKRVEVEDSDSVDLVQQEPSSSARTRAKPRSEINRAPTYPRRARQQGQQGTVLLRVTVGTKGRVVRVEVAESSGFTLLDDQALKCVKRWRFEPATDVSGHAIEDTYSLPLEFRLEDGPQ